MRFISLFRLLQRGRDGWDGFRTEQHAPPCPYLGGFCTEHSIRQESRTWSGLRRRPEVGVIPSRNGAMGVGAPSGRNGSGTGSRCGARTAGIGTDEGIRLPGMGKGSVVFCRCRADRDRGSVNAAPTGEVCI